MRSVKLKMHQIHFRPDPAGGAYDTPSDLLVGWGGRCSLPMPLLPRRSRKVSQISIIDLWPP